ncbi:MAG: hypothetical protein ACPL3C_09210 [Pyrobaculum sp.]|uniref:hypothetical protein n=1 Tax=Pyrobaculum sp. TaxID=2004705 RepID=UPI003CA4DEE5
MESGGGGVVGRGLLLARSPDSLYYMCCLCEALRSIIDGVQGYDVGAAVGVARKRLRSAVKKCRRGWEKYVLGFPSVTHHMLTYLLYTSAHCGGAVCKVDVEKLSKIYSELCSDYRAIAEKLRI